MDLRILLNEANFQLYLIVGEAIITSILENMSGEKNLHTLLKNMKPKHNFFIEHINTFFTILII